VTGAPPHKRELLVGEIGVLERERERVGFMNFTVALCLLCEGKVEERK
jgi:hypothetical protein